MSYPPIEDHGIIGDLHTVALVSKTGCIDWCCLPHFDSPSVFAGILDDTIGGWFSLNAHDVVTHKQMYLPDSNVLVTRAYTHSALGHIEDFMPIAKDKRKTLHQIIRRVVCIRGEITYTLDCTPAFQYAMNDHKTFLTKDGAVFETEGNYIYALSSPIKLTNKGKSVTATFKLREGESLSFIFFCVPQETSNNPFTQLRNPDAEFEHTLKFWEQWSARSTYTGRWREMVNRSALTLKLLTFEPTGAIVAAPTLGLPEHIGGPRNWDYRYTWIRDASFTIYALMRIGYHDEAEAFMQWLSARCKEIDYNSRVPLPLMFGIYGEHILPESTLDHLKGYKNSSPVRVGNAAYDQMQLDIYGELMDSVYLYNKYAKPISYDLWKQLQKLIDWVSNNWDQPDEGIWETRGGQQNFVYSRLMCWVALDRATRMCIKHSRPGDVVRWARERDKIYEQIMTKGWNKKRQAFRQHYNTDALDSATLLMPLVKFISPNDPRMLSNINEILKTLTTDSLTYRYDPSESPDGLAGAEGTFSICTFWLVECLTRAGRIDEARLIFQKMLSYANELGLYGEEIGYHGETLGNFPQAFTHLSLISAAFNLDQALNKRM